MKKKLIICVLLIFCAFDAKAQFASQKDASYLAIVKAVIDYKINDAEEIAHVQELREDQRFNTKLNKMLGELQNSRAKNSKNQRVLDILLKAGKDIDNVLNVR